MSTPGLRESSIELSAANVGGIDETTVTLEPGVTVLEGPNATNRTSLLQAIMAALGSDRPTLKGDADEGHVELAVGDAVYTRRLVRRGDGVAFEGEPYLDDPELADLFAFLLESNEARRAVERGDDLREVIMRPIDTEEIRRRIDALEAEKREIDATLEELSTLADERADLEHRLAELDAEIDRREAELEGLEAELESADRDPSDDESAQAEIEEAFERLRRARAELEDLEFDRETEREARTELAAERDRLADELADIETSDDDPEALAARIEELRERERALDATVSELGSVVRFNEARLDEGGLDVAVDEEAKADDGQVTDRLLDDDGTITCWTCGSAVERERVESTMERLRDLQRERLEERNEVQARIDELGDRESTLRERERRRSRLEERLEEVDEEITARDERIQELETDIADQRERVEALAAETDDLDATAADEELIEAHREASQIELELDQRHEERDRLEERRDELDERLGEREELADRREAVDDELADLRTRVERIEADAVRAFNDHMEAILSILEYANLERVWIERREREVRDGSGTGTERALDLHVVRTTADGETYEDTIEHLSESEREVTGLVFALAGYLVHEAHETVPFVLLDSLEAIDAERIADLVEYFGEFADYLVVALLPEDAAALSDEYAYLTEI